MSQQLREEWRPYDPPIICAAEEDFIPLCYFNYAFLLYFLYCDILYHSNKYISLIFASSHLFNIYNYFSTHSSLIFTIVWPPVLAASILGKVDAKMQILLHLKRFTKSRVCIRADTDSPSSLEKARGRNAKAVISPAKIANVHVRTIFIRRPDFG